MRKMKKINGYLVVRFNDREKRDDETLGSFGVIDAEEYTGDLEMDRGAMEYNDADSLEVAIEQARGLNAEEDYEAAIVVAAEDLDINGETIEAVNAGAATNYWICTCGAENKGKYCTESGKGKPSGIPQYKCDKCGWAPNDKTPPPLIFHDLELSSGRWHLLFYHQGTPTFPAAHPL